MKVYERKLTSLLGVEPRYPKGIGIEIEWEGYRRLTPFTLVRWVVTHDGSLRNNGVEYVSVVLNGPDEVVEAMDELTRVKGTAFQASSSFRCGLHVHLSMHEATIGQWLAFCCLYALVEPALMDMAGEPRQDNIFCVPWYQQCRALELFNVFKPGSVLRSSVFHHRLASYGNKYMANNWLRLRDLGTMEIRMAPTWDDLEQIKEWVLLCDRLRSVAFSFDGPEEIIEMVEDGLAAELYETCGLPYVPEDLTHFDEAVDAAYQIGYLTRITKEDIDWSFGEENMTSPLMDKLREGPDPSEKKATPYEVEHARIMEELRRGRIRTPMERVHAELRTHEIHPIEPPEDEEEDMDPFEPEWDDEPDVDFDYEEGM